MPLVIDDLFSPETFTLPFSLRVSSKLLLWIVTPPDLGPLRANLVNVTRFEKICTNMLNILNFRNPSMNVSSS
jgi:hypothetical protein